MGDEQTGWRARISAATELLPDPELPRSTISRVGSVAACTRSG
jgi:hypothetical protein